MEKTHLQFTLTISCLCLLWVSGFSSVPSRYSLGIDPKDESYYRPNVIKCKDGSKKFTREQLNDEFCDCPDGTDEPGTSACPQGKFYCKNAGHVPLTIFSSRVNDGICDCCDGSDEYDGTVNCQNTCWEAGKEARNKLNKKIKTYQEGVTVRKREIEMAKQAFAKDEEDLSKLKSEEKILKDLVDKLIGFPGFLFSSLNSFFPPPSMIWKVDSKSSIINARDIHLEVCGSVDKIFKKRISEFCPEVKKNTVADYSLK